MPDDTGKHPLKLIELDDAFGWFCDVCSKENFCRPAPAGQGRHRGRIYEYHCIPDTVTCSECKTVFETYYEVSE